ncbi:hypothetical protein J1N35_041367 [Gossypium stocksii]|uniref:Uncharacterized protein n=1 Tax=Gossypium stocksii TaxID=47602 RepID=A0A9D3UFU6_9ROSI|nr:hypothetical protein J1N35_041367 [Gossypium stocksii]
MFTDKRFASSSAPLDKRGKPKKGNTQGSLRHYYHLEEEEGEEEKRKKAALSEEDGTEEESDTSESDTSEMPQMDSDGELEEEEISESGSTTEEEDIDIDYEDREPEIQLKEMAKDACSGAYHACDSGNGYSQAGSRGGKKLKLFGFELSPSKNNGNFLKGCVEGDESINSSSRAGGVDDGDSTNEKKFECRYCFKEFAN